jgi:hypothetical protein
MKLSNPNDDPIIARINNSMPVRKRKQVRIPNGNKRHCGGGRKYNSWRRNDLSVSIPNPEVVFGEKECDHNWMPMPRMMNEHTTYECRNCGIEDGYA